MLERMFLGDQGRAMTDLPGGAVAEADTTGWAGLEAEARRTFA
jgi:hypothetical protein